MAGTAFVALTQHLRIKILAAFSYWVNLRKSRSYWREGGHVQVKSANIVHRCLPGGFGSFPDIGKFHTYFHS